LLLAVFFYLPAYSPITPGPTNHVLHCGSPSQPLRGWRWLDNDLVNFISSGAGALLAAGFWIFIVGQ
jgi:hypothetical protein